MARYIDKDALLDWLEKVDGCIADGTVEAPTLYKQIITDIKNFGEDDVVPKSEVERLKRENEVLKTNNMSMCQSMPNIAKAERAEVAREIFEEIERNIINSNFEFMFVNKKYFAELKKKYLGEKQC